jgi:predicted dehydrogenase
MSRIRLAVIGAGHLGRIHARLAKSLEAFELIGVVDPIAASRDAVAAEVGAPAFADHRELLDAIDAAIVATPTCHHHAVARDLLDAGKHVLVEKPITLCAADADDLLLAARRTRSVLQVGHVERFNPAFLAGERKIERPRLIDAVRAAPYTFRSTDVSVVLDLMIHDIDLALAVVNSKVVRIDATGGKVLGPNEDWAQARLTFASGAIANLSASRVAPAVQRTMHVVGDDGQLWLDFQAKTARLLRPSEAIRQGQIHVNRLSAEECRNLQATLATEHLPICDLPVVENNAILEEQREFARAITTGLRVVADGRVGRDAVAVAEQVLATIATSRPTVTESSPAFDFLLPLRRVA